MSHSLTTQVVKTKTSLASWPLLSTLDEQSRKGNQSESPNYNRFVQ